MPIIKLETEINAPIEICFDLSRSIDLHKISTAKTHEEAIGGKTKGLIGMNETVTWQATHFGIKQKLASKITAFNSPFYFRDEQQKGIFKSIYHEHIFEQKASFVLMIDVFKFQSPCGVFGKIFNHLILTNYLHSLLYERNKIIKEFAESNKWKLVLSEKNYAANLGQ